METQTIETQNKAQPSCIDKINTQINEERLFKDLSALQLSRITLLHNLSLQILEGSEKEQAIQILKANLEEYPDLLVAHYILGVLELNGEKKASGSNLPAILEDLVKLSKWPVVDHIADVLLEVEPENRTALRAKVESIGHLKGKKESRPFLEKLAYIDRKNPDVAKKYGLSILEEDRVKALQYLRQAGETYACLKDYKNLEDIWMLVIQNDYQDIAFFERIERIVVGDRQKVWVASHLAYLVEPFRVEENWANVILILKKILHYEPYSSRARSDLVRAYRAKYAEHTLLSEFLKISELTNHKRSVEACIASFERNIVFDLGNYVYHRTRGVGKITQIDSSKVVVDFSDNPGQEMSTQMAIHSLQPLRTDHIWARHYENPSEIEEFFADDLHLFLEALLSSFGNRMTMAEIKHEVTSRLLKPGDWSKWWSRVRSQVKKDPRFGFNPHKKDELLLRETPMTLTEELSLRFQGETSWNKKMEIAFVSLKDSDTEGATLVAIQFYKANETNKDTLKCLHSYLFLEHAKEAMGEDIPNRKIKAEAVQKLIGDASPKDIQQWSMNTQVMEIKRDLVNLVSKNRQDYASILKGFLFELPIKIHRFIFAEMIRFEQEKVLQEYVSELCRKYREHPEVFLWMARSILSGQWNEYSWVKVGREDIFLLVFRLLKPLSIIEKKGTRLKNMALNTICGTTNITTDSLQSYEVLVELVKQVRAELLFRMYALFRDVPYIPDAHKENMLDFIRKVRPDVSIDSIENEAQDQEKDSLLPPPGTILSSLDALNKRRHYMDHLIHVEMPANSREIGEAQEKGDLRENAEYKAAMEYQSQLQAKISSISKELQQAQALRPVDVNVDFVSIGTRIQVKLSGTSTIEEFTILGPWDTDTEKNIISYDSPLARVLLGKKIGEKASLDAQKKYEICEIHSALS